MLKGKKEKVKLAKKDPHKEELYEDDFEYFDYNDDDDDDDILKKLGIDNEEETVMTSSIVSTSPDTDSAGNKMNTKSSNMGDYEFDETEYDFEEEIATTCSGKFNFRDFRDAINNIPMVDERKFKNGTRSSLTFTNDRVKEIHRDNQILLDKIMRNGPSGDYLVNTKKQSFSFNKQRPLIKSAAEINRRRKQQKIEYENQILKRKLEKIASRSSRPLSNTLSDK